MNNNTNKSYNDGDRHTDDGSIGPLGGSRMPDAIQPHTCISSSADYELALILKEIRYITDTVSNKKNIFFFISLFSFKNIFLFQQSKTKKD